MQQPSSGDANFGTLLRAHRSNLGLTQEALAELAGLSRRGIADLERGARLAPYSGTVERLASALRLTESQRVALVDASRRAPTPNRTRLRLLADRTDGLVPVESPAARHNLPVQPTSFVGRHREQTEIARLLESAPLVTLVGPGGVGKTRLALEVAAGVARLFPDGVWLVELAPLSDSSLIAQAVAAVLGVQQRSEVDLATSLATWLRSRRMLLVLDNCEHVVEACAQLCSQLVHTCPDLRLLVTSRAVLDVQGETLVRVDGLGVADAARSAQSHVDSEAVRLFVDRARAAAPGFSLTARNTPAVVQVCEQLDGLPLALELAAARLRTMSVEDLATRLDQRFELLTGGKRDALPRHRTLRALVDWSYDLLNAAERKAFERLSVCTGGWTLDAAEAVCGPELGSTLDLLSQLIDKSLVQPDRQPDGSVRYRMLETLRQYALETLTSRGEADDIHHRHALFFTDALARRWGRRAWFWYGESTVARLASVERDYDNFRASLRWLVDRHDTQAAERLATVLLGFWALGGRVEEGRAWVTEVLELPDDSAAPSPSRLRLGEGLAQLEALGGNRAAGLRRLEALLPGIREFADAPTLSLALGLAASLTWYARHDLVAARALAEEGLRVAQTTGITSLESQLRGRLAHVMVEGGEYAFAEHQLQAIKATDTWSRPRAIIDLARVRFGQANFEAAASLLERLVDKPEVARSPLEPMLALTVLSQVRLARGDVAGALVAGTQALVLVRENLGRTMSFGHLPGPLEALAMVATAAVQPEVGLRLAAAAANLRESYSERLSPIEHARLERCLDSARRAVGPRATAAAWAAGWSFGAEAAMDVALSLTPSAGNGREMPLTPREHEVMLLAAQGLTNRQIGQRLVITEGTARVHVERVLGKLGLHSRAQLAAWALLHENYGADTCLFPDAEPDAHA